MKTNSHRRVVSRFKKGLLAGTALLAALTASADGEHGVLDIYRNDNVFNHYRLSEVEEISYEKGSGGEYATMMVKDAKVKTAIALSAIDSCRVSATTLPDIYINLTDYPNIDDLFKGNGFTKSTIYQATMRLDGNGTYDDIAEQTVEFRGRGNSTWRFAKTPYRFKMAKKAQVCGLPKAKTFALIANYIDPTHIRNTIAFWTARELGLPYTNHSAHCNVYLNGRYKGLYMMTEKIGIGGGSVDIDENTGMMFELDTNYDEDFQFRHEIGASKGLPVMVKDPDLTEIKPDPAEREAYWQAWQADFGEMADAVMAGGAIEDYIDLWETARYILVYNLACNREVNHPKSVNLFKEGLGSEYKYRFGPVWDFDWSTGFRAAGPTMNTYNRVLASSDDSTPGAPFMRALVSNKAFMEAYREAWAQFKSEVYPRLMEYIDGYAAEIEPSAKRDGVLWPDAWANNEAWAQSSFDTAKHIGNLKTWLANRVKWLDNHARLGLY